MLWTWISFPFRCGQYLIRWYPPHPQHWSGFLVLSPIILAGLITGWDGYLCLFQKWEGLKPFFLWLSFTFFLREFLLLPSVFVVWCPKFICLWRSVKLYSMAAVNWFFSSRDFITLLFSSMQLCNSTLRLLMVAATSGEVSWFLFSSNYVSTFWIL